MSFGTTVSEGYNYFGSYAQAVCMGPVQTLWRIRNGKTVIWEGPVYAADANASGYTALTTDIGSIRFYWGTVTQVADTILAQLYVDGGQSASYAHISPLKRICYAVMDDVAFGKQTAPPVLKFEVSRHTSNLTLDGKVGEVRVAGSADYTSSPTVGFTGGGGSGAAATAIINTEGEVVDVLVTNPGTGYTSAPTVTLTGGGGTYTSATADLVHAVSGNGLVPEMIYDLFTDGLYGLGVDPSNFITSSFVDACDTVRDEGLGFNANIESQSSARSWIGRLLDLIQAVLYVENGKVGIKLVRKESTSGIPTVDESVLTDEPTFDNTLLADTWNLTVIKWVDRRNLYERTTEPFYNDANLTLQGEEVRREFDVAFCNTEEVARKVAARKGIQGGTPEFRVNLNVLPSVSLENGDLFWLSYTKGGITNRLMRVVATTRDQSGSDQLGLTAVEEFTLDWSVVYDAGKGNTTIGPALGDDGRNIQDAPVPTVTPRLAYVPGGLKTADDAALVAFGRPHPLLSKARAFFTWSPAEKSYFMVAQVSSFPAEGEVVWFQRYRTTNWLFRIEFATQGEAAGVVDLLSDGGAEVYLVVNLRDAKPSTSTDADSFESAWLRPADGGTVNLIDTTTVEIEVASADFGSRELDLETLADDGVYPSLAAYVGTRESFCIAHFKSIQFERDGHNGAQNRASGLWPDGNRVRYLKVQTFRGAKSADLADCPESTYEWGVELTPTWGTYAETAAERADNELGNYYDSASETDLYGTVEGHDDALGAVFDGIETEAELLLAEHVDDVLGRVYLERDGIYSESR